MKHDHARMADVKTVPLKRGRCRIDKERIQATTLSSSVVSGSAESYRISLGGIKPWLEKCGTTRNGANSCLLRYDEGQFAFGGL
jgi:hypothetical protein